MDDGTREVIVDGLTAQLLAEYCAGRSWTFQLIQKETRVERVPNKRTWRNLWRQTYTYNELPWVTLLSEVMNLQPSLHDATIEWNAIEWPARQGIPTHVRIWDGYDLVTEFPVTVPCTVTDETTILIPISLAFL